MIINLRTAGSEINIYYVVKGVLAGRSNIKVWSVYGFSCYEVLGAVALWTNEIFSASINNEQAKEHTFGMGRGVIPTQYCLQSQ